MALSENDVKAELSYAYLHAVAARAGFSCGVGNRHDDGVGVDAVVRFKERLAADVVYTESFIEVQLKATALPPSGVGRFAFPLRTDHYDKLRTTGTSLHRFLVVLFLPEDAAEWLRHAADELRLRRCAYWCSLRGAPASANRTRQTVYLPAGNVLSVEGLRGLMTRVARNHEWCDGVG